MPADQESTQIPVSQVHGWIVYLIDDQGRPHQPDNRIYFDGGSIATAWGMFRNKLLRDNSGHNTIIRDDERVKIVKHNDTLFPYTIWQRFGVLTPPIPDFVPSPLPGATDETASGNEGVQADAGDDGGVAIDEGDAPGMEGDNA